MSTARTWCFSVFVTLLVHHVIASCPIGYVGADCKIECGITSGSRIYGGTNASANSWPAQVLIKFNSTGSFYISKLAIWVKQSQISICGGTLIDASTVLTAAHCIVTSVLVNYGLQTFNIPIDIKSSSYTVYFGKYPNIYRDVFICNFLHFQIFCFD